MRDLTDFGMMRKHHARAQTPLCAASIFLGVVIGWVKDAQPAAQAHMGFGGGSGRGGVTRAQVRSEIWKVGFLRSAVRNG